MTEMAGRTMRAEDSPFPPYWRATNLADYKLESVRPNVGTYGRYPVRFLADQQGCAFWYLYLIRGGVDHAVVSSPGFYGTDDENWRGDARDPADIAFAAESFKALLCRFWIENEVFFANSDGTPMPDIGCEYIDRYSGEQ